ncbi:MAG: MASE3 domain-containing protein [Patescibacteria group bacterium]|jgi:PAS domain S-box-containing protein
MKLLKPNNKINIKARSILLTRTYQPYHFHYLIWFLMAAILSAILFYISRYNYLIFHSFIDLAVIIIACSVFLIVFNSYRFLSNHYLLIIGASFLSISLIDFLHVIAYRGMSVLPLSVAESTNLATQLWVADRILVSISFVVAPLFLNKRIKGRYVLLSYSIATAALLLSILYFKNFPIAYDEQAGLTLFKKITEYSTSSLFILAGFLLYLRRRFVDRVILRLMMMSIVLTTAAGMSFVLYVDVYGFYNYIGHMFRLYSFYLVYRAIIVTSLIKPYDILFWDLKQSEKRLRAQAEQLQREKDEEEALISSLKDAIIAVDKDGMVLYANKPLLELVGCKKVDIRGKHQEKVLKLYDSKDQPIPFGNRPLGRVLFSDSVSSVHSDSYYIRRGRRKIYVSIVATPVVSNNKTIGAIALYRDITKEREMEKSKSDFIAFAAHQLRTPLTAASLATEVTLSQSLAPETRARLTDIGQEIVKMSDIIKKLLNISRLEMGLWPVNLEVVNIAEEIDRCLQDFHTIIESKSLKIDRVYNSSLAPLKTDLTLLLIILDNLISNAVKYSEPGGSIKVEASRADDEIILEIADTGKGIPEEQQHRIFDKMFRAKNVSRSDGTGLGLYMTKSIVEQIGGRIWFESKTDDGVEPAGTSFFVALPLSASNIKKGRASRNIDNKTKSSSGKSA